MAPEPLDPCGDDDAELVLPWPRKEEIRACKRCNNVFVGDTDRCDACTYCGLCGSSIDVTEVGDRLRCGACRSLSYRVLRDDDPPDSRPGSTVAIGIAFGLLITVILAVVGWALWCVLEATIT